MNEIVDFYKNSKYYQSELSELIPLPGLEYQSDIYLHQVVQKFDELTFGSKSILDTMATSINETESSLTYDIDDERRISSDFFQNEKSDKKETIKKKQTSEKEYKTKIEKDKKITPITIIKTNQIETTNHLFPLNNIFCSLHQKDYIKFDSDSFSIVCTKCLDEGKESHLQFINNIYKLSL